MEPTTLTLIRDPNRLAAVRRVGLLDAPPDPALDRLARLATRALHAPIAIVALIDDKRQFLQSSVGLPGRWAIRRNISLDVGSCPEALARTGPTVMPDLESSPLSRNNPAVTELGAKSYLGAPLVASGGEHIGVFCVYDTKRRNWSHEEIAILEDFVGLAQAEFRLRESEARFRRLAELSPEPMAVHAAGTIIYVNDAVVRALGARTREDVLGRTVHSLVHPEDREKVLERMRRSHHEDTENEVIEERFIRFDGRTIDVEVASLPVTFENASATFVLMRDVTGRRRQERETLLLADASRALAGSLDVRDTLQHAAELAIPMLADWCVVVDGFDHTEPAAFATAARNPSIRAALEHATDFLPDASHLDFETAKVMNRSEWNDWLRTVGRVTPKEIEPTAVVIVPLRFRTTWVGSMTFARMSPEATYSREDISLAAELAYRSAQALDNARLYREAENTLKQRDDFLAAVSHDLRSPLTAMMMRAELMNRMVRGDGPVDPAPLRDGIHSMQRATGRMTRLVNELLDSATLRIGRTLELDRSATDLVASARAAIAEQCERTRAERPFNVRVPDEPVVGQWDEPRLHRVVVNLLENAVKYSPAGSPIDLDIEKTREGDREWARLRVSDRGIGIPPDELAHVFQPYFRASNVTGHVSGTGLGLSISAQIAKLHGGDMSVEPRDGGGTIFALRLPIDPQGSA